MGVFAPAVNETFDFIVRQDDALDMTDEEYQSYLESGADSDCLKLKEGVEPTRFVLRKTLKYDDHVRISGMKAKFDATGKFSSDLSFISEEVRCLLIDIKNPDSVPVAHRIMFKRGSDQRASKETMEMIQGLDAINAMYVAYTSALQRNGEVPKKK